MLQSDECIKKSSFVQTAAGGQAIYKRGTTHAPVKPARMWSEGTRWGSAHHCRWQSPGPAAAAAAGGGELPGGGGGHARRPLPAAECD